MKKLLSLLLVLCLVVALAPAAYAADAKEYVEVPGVGKTKVEVEDWDKAYQKNNGDLLKTIFDTELLYTEEAAEGIVKDNGHLYGCSGGNCYCLETIIEAEKEYQAQKAKEDLKVWISSKRGDDLVRRDTIVVEVEQAGSIKAEEKNQSYLDGKENVKALLEDFVDDDDMAEELYRGTDFLNTQIRVYSEQVKNGRNSGETHVEYRLMEYCNKALDISEDKAANYIFSCNGMPITDWAPVDNVYLRAGNLLVTLPEKCIGEGFTVGLGLDGEGSVRVLLADDEGKLIPGAVLSYKQADGEVVNFEASTGDDVIDLSK